MFDNQAMKKSKQTDITIPFPKLKKYLPRLVQAEERIDYKSGQVIFYEGHSPLGICILRKGRVRLFRESENGDEILQQIIEHPQILGEEAFVANKSYGYSARAETDVSISFFSRLVIDTEKNGMKHAG